MSAVASFHLITERPGRQPVVVARIGLDRLALRRVDGLLFARVLGTGRGNRVGVGVAFDASRSAVFALWRDEASLDRFLATHRIPKRWARAAESWHVRLRPLRCRGAWDGVELASSDADTGSCGPVAVLTRAAIRPRATRAFVRASRTMGDPVADAPGCRAVLGIGERPIGRLGTFSLWDDASSARRFARHDGAHVAAVTAARRDGWFTEELFAWFEPFVSTGSWDGVDPVGTPPAGQST